MVLIKKTDKECRLSKFELSMKNTTCLTMLVFR